MLYFLSFLFGASLGSFINLVVSRLGVARIVNTRSKCFSCDMTLTWKDLIPVFSYMALRGKCRNCKTKYGSEHLIVEIIFGLIFVCVYKFILLGQVDAIHSLSWLAYYTLFFVTLGVVTLYDLKHKVIPINFFYGFLLLTLLVLFLRFLSDQSYITLLAPFVVSSPFLLLWLLSRGKWLGFGDVLMFMAVGAFFGSIQGLAVFFLSVWIGAIIGLLFKFLEKEKYTLKTAIPFVPFIAIAIVIVLFTDIDVISILSIFK